MSEPQIDRNQCGEDNLPSPSLLRSSTDLRGYRRQTERHLIIGGFVLMFLVGGALIWHFYGAGAMLMAWFFMGGGVALFGGLYLILKLMERWSRDEE